MLIYILRRLIYVIPVAIAVGFVCFMLVQIAPGDPIFAIVAPDASPEIIAQVRVDYGLDKPLPVQFAYWLWRVLHGDLGTSLSSGRPVWSDLAPALANTLRLGLLAAAVGVSLGCILGGGAAALRGSRVEKVVSALSVAGISVPHYWFAMVLVILLSANLKVLPAMGAGPGGTEWSWDWEHIRYIILPTVALSLIPMGVVARNMRGLACETLNQEFVTTLRGKGLTPTGIGLHVLKNVAPSVLSVIGLQIGYLMGGSILIETVFSWPGTGLMLNGAIFQRDFPVIQGTVLVLAMFFVAINLTIDVIQTIIDPRIRRG